MKLISKELKMDPYTFAPVMRVTVELPIEIIDQVLTPSEDEIKMILGNGLYGVIKNERNCERY